MPAALREVDGRSGDGYDQFADARRRHILKSYARHHKLTPSRDPASELLRTFGNRYVAAVVEALGDRATEREAAAAAKESPEEGTLPTDATKTTRLSSHDNDEAVEPLYGGINSSGMLGSPSRRLRAMAGHHTHVHNTTTSSIPPRLAPLQRPATSTQEECPPAGASGVAVDLQEEGGTNSIPPLIATRGTKYGDGMFSSAPLNYAVNIRAWAPKYRGKAPVALSVPPSLVYDDWPRFVANCFAACQGGAAERSTLFTAMGTPMADPAVFFDEFISAKRRHDARRQLRALQWLDSLVAIDAERLSSSTANAKGTQLFGNDNFAPPTVEGVDDDVFALDVLCVEKGASGGAASGKKGGAGSEAGGCGGGGGDPSQFFSVTEPKLIDAIIRSFELPPVSGHSSVGPSGALTASEKAMLMAPESSSSDESSIDDGEIAAAGDEALEALYHLGNPRQREAMLLRQLARSTNEETFKVALAKNYHRDRFLFQRRLFTKDGDTEVTNDNIFGRKKLKVSCVEGDLDDEDDGGDDSNAMLARRRTFAQKVRNPWSNNYATNLPMPRNMVEGNEGHAAQQQLAGISADMRTKIAKKKRNGDGSGGGRGGRDGRLLILREVMQGPPSESYSVPPLASNQHLLRKATDGAGAPYSAAAGSGGGGRRGSVVDLAMIPIDLPPITEDTPTTALSTNIREIIGNDIADEAERKANAASERQKRLAEGIARRVERLEKQRLIYLSSSSEGEGAADGDASVDSEGKGIDTTTKRRLSASTRSANKRRKGSADGSRQQSRRESGNASWGSQLQTADVEGQPSLTSVAAANGDAAGVGGMGSATLSPLSPQQWLPGASAKRRSVSFVAIGSAPLTSNHSQTNAINSPAGSPNGGAKEVAIGGGDIAASDANVSYSEMMKRRRSSIKAPTFVTAAELHPSLIAQLEVKFGSGGFPTLHNPYEADGGDAAANGGRDKMNIRDTFTMTTLTSTMRKELAQQHPSASLSSAGTKERRGGHQPSNKSTTTASALLTQAHYHYKNPRVLRAFFAMYTDGLGEEDNGKKKLHKRGGPIAKRVFSLDRTAMNHPLPTLLQGMMAAQLEGDRRVLACAQFVDGGGGGGGGRGTDDDRRMAADSPAMLGVIAAKGPLSGLLDPSSSPVVNGQNPSHSKAMKAIIINRLRQMERRRDQPSKVKAPTFASGAVNTIASLKREATSDRPDHPATVEESLLQYLNGGATATRHMPAPSAILLRKGAPSDARSYDSTCMYHSDEMEGGKCDVSAIAADSEPPSVAASPERGGERAAKKSEEEGPPRPESPFARDTSSLGLLTSNAKKLRLSTACAPHPSGSFAGTVLTIANAKGGDQAHAAPSSPSRLRDAISSTDDGLASVAAYRNLLAADHATRLAFVDGTALRRRHEPKTIAALPPLSSSKAASSGLPSQFASPLAEESKPTATLVADDDTDGEHEQRAHTQSGGESPKPTASHLAVEIVTPDPEPSALRMIRSGPVPASLIGSRNTMNARNYVNGHTPIGSVIAAGKVAYEQPSMCGRAEKDSNSTATSVGPFSALRTFSRNDKGSPHSPHGARSGGSGDKTIVTLPTGMVRDRMGQRIQVDGGLASIGDVVVSTVTGELYRVEGFKKALKHKRAAGETSAGHQQRIADDYESHNEEVRNLLLSDPASPSVDSVLVAHCRRLVKATDPCLDHFVKPTLRSEQHGLSYPCGNHFLKFRKFWDDALVSFSEADLSGADDGKGKAVIPIRNSSGEETGNTEDAHKARADFLRSLEKRQTDSNNGTAAHASVGGSTSARLLFESLFISQAPPKGSAMWGAQDTLGTTTTTTADSGGGADANDSSSSVSKETKRSVKLARLLSSILRPTLGASEENISLLLTDSERRKIKGAGGGIAEGIALIQKRIKEGSRVRGEDVGNTMAASVLAETRAQWHSRVEKRILRAAIGPSSKSESNTGGRSIDLSQATVLSAFSGDILPSHLAFEIISAAPRLYAAPSVIFLTDECCDLPCTQLQPTTTEKSLLWINFPFVVALRKLLDFYKRRAPPPLWASAPSSSGNCPADSFNKAPLDSFDEVVLTDCADVLLRPTEPPRRTLPSEEDAWCQYHHSDEVHRITNAVERPTTAWRRYEPQAVLASAGYLHERGNGEEARCPNAASSCVICGCAVRNSLFAGGESLQ